MVQSNESVEWREHQCGKKVDVRAVEWHECAHLAWKKWVCCKIAVQPKAQALGLAEEVEDIVPGVGCREEYSQRWKV